MWCREKTAFWEITPDKSACHRYSCPYVKLTINAHPTELLRPVVRTALDRQFDLDFPDGRARGAIGVQGLPVNLNSFLGAGNQVLYRTPRDQNGRKFWYVNAIAGTVPFDN
jgi:hypothetical protein